MVWAELGVDREETASEESQSEKNNAESDSEPDHEEFIQKESSEPCHHCQNWNVFANTVVKCPSCFRHDNYSICPICGYETPVDAAEHIKKALARCYYSGALRHENMKTSKVSLYFLSAKEDKD